jgi:hypothetical protein
MSDRARAVLQALNSNQWLLDNDPNHKVTQLAEMENQLWHVTREERRKLAAILRIDEDSNILSQVETLRDFAELTSGSEGEQEEIRTLKAQRDALGEALEDVLGLVGLDYLNSSEEKIVKDAKTTLATTKGTN